MAEPATENAQDVKQNGSAEVQIKGAEVEDWDKLGEGQGKDLVLSEEEEKRLAMELGNWINADTNPYETADDPYFKKDAAEQATPAE
ncbi:hypothetical protein FRC17_006435 [Serendipita sp. 399]|nr:hypothetical protein FRC17_006435 [Serendipita sp. 399]